MISSTVTQYFNCEGRTALKICEAYNGNKSGTVSRVNGILSAKVSLKVGSVRKCSAAVVDLDLLLGLSMVRRCSLKDRFIA